MRSTVWQCFPASTLPEAFSHRSPNWMGHQCQALVSICCCCPGAHGLLLAPTGHRNLSRLMKFFPSGPRYLDIRLTEETTREELSAFLQKLQTSAAVATTTGPLKPPKHSHVKTLSTVSSDGETPTVCPPDVGGTSPVAIVLDIHNASPGVVAGLIEAMGIGDRASKRAGPSLHIIALCPDESFSLLPLQLASAFVLSACIPPCEEDEENYAEPLQLNQTLFSMLCDRSSRPIDNVYMHSGLERYVRQLIANLRCSMYPFSSYFVRAMGKTPMMYQVLKVSAMLFSANDARTDDEFEWKRITVSPTDVICLLPHFVAHLVRMTVSESEAMGPRAISGGSFGGRKVSGAGVVVASEPPSFAKQHAAWDAVTASFDAARDDYVPYSKTFTQICLTLREHGVPPP